VHNDRLHSRGVLSRGELARDPSSRGGNGRVRGGNGRVKTPNVIGFKYLLETGNVKNFSAASTLEHRTLRISLLH
jgi:hypothetical protein